MPRVRRYRAAQRAGLDPSVREFFRTGAMPNRLRFVPAACGLPTEQGIGGGAPPLHALRALWLEHRADLRREHLASGGTSRTFLGLEHAVLRGLQQQLTDCGHSEFLEACPTWLVAEVAARESRELAELNAEDVAPARRGSHALLNHRTNPADAVATATSPQEP